MKVEIISDEGKNFIQIDGKTYHKINKELIEFFAQKFKIRIEEIREVNDDGEIYYIVINGNKKQYLHHINLDYVSFLNIVSTLKDVKTALLLIENTTTIEIVEI